MTHLHAPHHWLIGFVAALQHVDDGLGSLSQADSLEFGRRLPMGFGLCHCLSLLQLLCFYRLLQGSDGLRHLIGFDDPLGFNGLANQA